MTVELSVVIPCYEAGSTLGVQLEALSRQMDPPPFEVIVVDNGSSDPPVEVTTTWCGPIDRLRLVQATGEQGTSYARNVGTSRAEAPKIVFCDADDVVGPTFLRAAYEALAQVDVVTGNVQPLSPEDFTHGVDGAWEALAGRRTSSNLGDVDRDCPDVQPEYPTLMGGACAFHVGVLRALDGWDQAFFPGAEDNDLGLRVLENGFTLGKSWAMEVAERPRSTASQMFHRAYDGGAMHMQLCAAHDLWTTSPHLSSPRWWTDLLKLPGVALKTVARDRSDATRLALLGRMGLRCGQARGFWTYRVRRRSVRPRTGVGLDLPQSPETIQ